MDSSNAIITRLYANVLEKDITLYRISGKSIRYGIYRMAKAYSPEHNGFNSDTTDFPDYNDPAFRCAYLHKYAAFHAYVVLNVMQRILKDKDNKDIFKRILNGQLQMCCLGGGPGTEAVGILLALHLVFSSFKASLNIIDCMEDWDATFESLIQELKFGQYGAFSDIFSSNFEWNYYGANLLTNMTNETNKSIGQSSLVTMVKFLSAASCPRQEAEKMLGEIFNVLKPGALLLYIDNAGGEFTEAVEEAAAKKPLRLIFVRRHMMFENESFKTERFMSSSCYQTKVTILLFQRLHQNRINCIKPLVNDSFATNHSRLSPQLRNNLKSKSAPLVKKDNLNHQRSLILLQHSKLIKPSLHHSSCSQMRGTNNSELSNQLLNYNSVAYAAEFDNRNRLTSGFQKPSIGDYRPRLVQNANLNQIYGRLSKDPGIVKPGLGDFRKYPTQSNFSVFCASFLGFPREILWEICFNEFCEFLGRTIYPNKILFLRGSN